MTITKEDVKECIRSLKEMAEKDRRNHGSTRAVNKAYEDRAEGLDTAANFLYYHLLPKAKTKKRLKA
jgi:hypothetical protein